MPLWSLLKKKDKIVAKKEVVTNLKFLTVLFTFNNGLLSTQIISKVIHALK